MTNYPFPPNPQFPNALPQKGMWRGWPPRAAGVVVRSTRSPHTSAWAFTIATISSTRMISALQEAFSPGLSGK